MKSLERRSIFTDDELLMGRKAKDYIIRKLDGEIPSADEIRALRVPRELYIEPEVALQKTEPHGVSHTGRLLVLGIPYITYYQKIWDNLKQPRVVIESLRFHDIRLSNAENYPTHAKDAVVFMEKHGIPPDLVPIWQSVAYIMSHHSDAIENDPPNEGIHTALFYERCLMQDLDASDLTRDGADKPIETIRFRLYSSRNLRLSYIMQYLRMTAQKINTGDAFEDQVQAGIQIGILRPS